MRLSSLHITWMNEDRAPLSAAHLQPSESSVWRRRGASWRALLKKTLDRPDLFRIAFWIASRVSRAVTRWSVLVLACIAIALLDLAERALGCAAELLARTSQRHGRPVVP